MKSVLLCMALSAPTALSAEARVFDCDAPDAKHPEMKARLVKYEDQPKGHITIAEIDRDVDVFPGLDTLVFSLILIGFIIYEPLGLYGRWLKLKAFWDLFPLSRRDMFRRQMTYLKTERMK